MTKSFKKITFLTLALLMVMSMSATAFAGSTSITFTGFTGGFEFQPGSEYTETNLFGNFKNVMPGDTVTDTITFTNSATDCDFVNLYIRAEAHDDASNALSSDVAASGETVVTMSEFLSKLSMKVWNGSELIFDASPDQLDGLTDNKFIGMYRTGETATLKIELSVPIDLGNEYANRMGEVDWIFHVEAFNESQLSVRKVWSDGNDAHANDSVTVNLLKDGQPSGTTAVLNAENNWAYTFDQLVEGYTWTVEEAEVPEGYTVSYETVGTMTTITNTKEESPEPSYPLDIAVQLQWKNDDEDDRPKSVTVSLYNGSVLCETVSLNVNNNWSYTWKDADKLGNWQVVETNIPKGYAPSYSVDGNVVTITNTKSLIQTGQLNWPVWVMGGAGLALVALGGAILIKKKRENNA